MSHYPNNNSKNRQSNFSKSSYSNSQHKYGSNGSQYNQYPSYTPQAPSSQPSQNNYYTNKSSNNSYTAPLIPEVPNYSRPYKEPPGSSSSNLTKNTPYSSSITTERTQSLNYGSLHVEKKIVSNPGQNDSESKHRSYQKQETNSSGQKSSHSHQTNPPLQTQNNDKISDSNPDRSKETSKSMILEDNGHSAKIEKEKIQDPRQNLNKKTVEKHKINHEEQDLELVQKKKKSESKYGDRLTTLEHEIGKIKSKEVQVLRAIISTGTLEVSDNEATKKITNLSQQGKIHITSSKIPSNYLINQSLYSLNPEQLRDHVCEILTEKLKSTAELQLSKQQLITLTRESEKGEEISNNNHINEEGKDHEPKKIVHISQQIVRQSDPKIRELEDRLEKMEFLIHDRSQKTREAVKNGTETAFGLEVAEAKNEIFTCRLKNRGFEV